jgi:hypothetical protein
MPDTYDNSDHAVAVLNGMESKRKPGARTGVAPKIRILKDKYPEMSEVKIAKRVGCSPSNVHVVLSKYLGDNCDDDLREYQANKGDVFDSLAMRSVLSITDDKLVKSSAAQLSIIAATAFDKSQLARGQATGINVTVLMDVVEALRSRGPVQQSASVAKPADSTDKSKVVQAQDVPSDAS